MQGLADLEDANPYVRDVAEHPHRDSNVTS
jgi:hypothetical protein